MSDDEYICAVCRRTFQKGRADEEAIAESLATFGIPIRECKIVCDDCYKEMGYEEITKGK